MVCATWMGEKIRAGLKQLVLIEFRYGLEHWYFDCLKGNIVEIHWLLHCF